MAGTGVFLCTCGKDLQGKLDFKKIAKEVKGEARLVEVADYLCQQDISYITQHLRWGDERKLGKVVIGACSPRMKGDVFKAALREHGLMDDSLSIADIREGVAWVHGDRKGATEKAVALLTEAIESEPPLPFVVKVAAPVLLYGGSEALKTAQELASLGVESVVVNNAPLGGDACLTRVPPLVHFPYEIIKVKGKLGEFEVYLERERYIDPGKCISCAKCVTACPAGAVSYAPGVIPAYYLNPELCSGCEDCLRVCPTEAINLGSDAMTLKVGQIISFHEGVAVREGVYKGGEAFLKAAAYAAGVKKYNKPSYLKETCANMRIIGKELSVRGCDYCINACPYGVISYSGELIIDSKACVGCGLCQSSCPLGCLQMKVHGDEEIHSKIEAFMSAKVEPKLLMFACNCGRATVEAAGSKRLEYPLVMPIYLPCLGYLSESHILRCFELGAQGVFMLGCDGGKCSFNTGFRTTGEKVKVVRRILEAFGLGKERVRLMGGDPEQPEDFVNRFKSFAGKLRNNPLEGKGVEPLDLEKTRRGVLLSQLLGLKEKLGEPQETVMGGDTIPFGKVVVSDKCVSCGACASHCATGALTTGRARGYAEALFFNYPHCIACDICKDICPEKAIEIERVFDLQAFIRDEKVSFEGEMHSCAKCGKPFMSMKMYEKLKATLGESDALNHCHDCREDAFLEEMFGG